MQPRCFIPFRRVLCGAALFVLAPMFALGWGEEVQAGTPVTFAFFKKLEVSPDPFTDGNAYWRGKGKFSGSNEVYDLLVTLPADAKFPNNPVPGVITPTAMKYTISRNGNVIKEIRFVGYADLRNGTMFLHNGSLTPQTPPDGWPAGVPYYPFPEAHHIGDILMNGVIKSIWVRQPDKGAKGPLVVEGQIVFPTGI